MNNYYMVRIDKKSWTKETVTIEETEARGFHVQPARRIGDMDVFYNNHKVAIMFESKIEAAKFALN